MNPEGEEGSQEYFVNKKTGSRTSRLTAKKMPDGTWETMEALKDRLRDTWNVDDVECTYDEKGNCVTSPASEGKKAKRNRKSKERRKAKKAEKPETPEEPEKPAEEEVEALEADPRPVKEEEAEPMGKATIEAVGFTKSETEESNDSEPVPSEDGERLYELTGTTASNIKSLNELFDTWSWEDGLTALKDKVMEEAVELMEGGDEKPVMDGKILKVIGTSAASECLTVIICALKLLHMQGIDVNTSIRALYPRHLEQYERYKHLQDDPGSGDLGKAQTV